MECSDDFLMAVSNIVGSSSAAAMAIAERGRRVAAGEDAVVYWLRDKRTLLVGPRIKTHNNPEHQLKPGENETGAKE